MARNRSLAGQKLLFPEAIAAEEVSASLRTWPDGDLLKLAREVGYELIRRGSAVPAALPIGEAMASVSGHLPAQWPA
jgi:hypothetical protein